MSRDESRDTKSNAFQKMTMVHLSSQGKSKHVAGVVVVDKGTNWITAYIPSYDVSQFGIPEEYSKIEVHLFKFRPVWVAQYVNTKGISFRNYYNIIEPVSIRQDKIVYTDLELDVVEDYNGFHLIDTTEFQEANLSRRQIQTVKDGLMQIIRGEVREWCSHTTLPLRPIPKKASPGLKGGPS